MQERRETVSTKMEAYKEILWDIITLAWPDHDMKFYIEEWFNSPTFIFAQDEIFITTPGRCEKMPEDGTGSVYVLISARTDVSALGIPNELWAVLNQPIFLDGQLLLSSLHVCIYCR